MSLSPRSIALLTGFGLCAAHAAAAVVFEQNFDGATLAGVTGTSVNQFRSLSQGAGADPHSFAIVSDAFHIKNAADGSYPTASASGSNFASELGANVFELTFLAAPIATITGGNTAAIVYIRSDKKELRLDIRVDSSGGIPRIQPRAEGGSSLSLFSAPIEIRIIANPSAAEYSYLAPDGTTRTIAASKWDVWAGTASSSRGMNMTATTQADQLQLQIPGWSGANGTVSVDDLRLQTVPEPSAAMASLGGAALLLRRRRTSSRS